jgi:glycosyltransferase involved in cell wall biosynthesis
MFLTIAIPTYKSEGTLCRLLQSISKQITEINQNEIEILICDNDSNSNVLDRVHEIFNQNTKINALYHKNTENLGYDGNLSKLLSLSSGEYIKFIADDDFVHDTFLTNHLDILRLYQPDIVVSEFEVFKDLPNFETITRETNCRIFLSPPWSISKINLLRGRFGQISSLTFKRDTIINLNQPKLSNFIHTFWLFSVIETSQVVFDRSSRIFVQLGSPNFSSGIKQILETQFQSLNAIKFASVSDKKLKRLILHKSQNYVFRYLRLVSGMRFRDRLGLLFKFREDFGSRPLLFLFYGLNFLIPIFAKKKIATPFLRMIRKNFAYDTDPKIY